MCRGDREPECCPPCFSEIGCLIWSYRSPISLGLQASQHLESTCLCLIGAGIKFAYHHARFLHRCWGTKSGPYISLVNILLIEPPPQKQYSYCFKIFKFISVCVCVCTHMHVYAHACRYAHLCVKAEVRKGCIISSSISLCLFLWNRFPLKRGLTFSWLTQTSKPQWFSCLHSYPILTPKAGDTVICGMLGLLLGHWHVSSTLHDSGTVLTIGPFLQLQHSYYF